MNINYNHIVDYLNNIYIDEDFIEIRNYGIENNIPIMKKESKEFLLSQYGIIDEPLLVILPYFFQNILMQK